MPEVTSVKIQKSRKRVNVFLDGKFGFGIGLEYWAKTGISVGKVYTQKQIDEIVRKSSYQDILLKLFNFCLVRPRSVREIEIWFGKKGVADSLRKDLYTALKKEDLVGDETFAKWWVSQRIEKGDRSKRMIVNELFKKGISKDVIENAVGEFELNDIKTAKNILARKKGYFAGKDKKNVFRRKAQYLLRKGFSWETVKKIIPPVD